uniref:LRRCT domain-containing protein n=1 Tax=Trichuris muris TaxID=70415 RepID=A0A5S6R1E9_TRIMR
MRCYAMASMPLLAATMMLWRLGRCLCPSGCQCNQDTLTVNCSRAGLSSVPILLNPRIRSLTLSNNVISELAADELGFYAELEYLDMSSNRILTIAPGAFHKLHKLRVLKLGANRLTDVGAETFSGLGALKLLDLGDNELTRLPTSVFSDMASLEALNLSTNFVGSIAPGAFAGLTKVKELHLQDNQLTALVNQPFRDLRALKLLDLSANHVARLPSYCFSTLHHLEVLNMAGNRLESIEEDTFAGLSSIGHLHLDRNRLNRIPTLSFQPLSDLSLLTISDNPFDELSTSCFEGLSRLTQLVITKCPHLRTVNLNAFSGLFDLETLILAENPALSQFHPLAFETDAPLALKQVYLFGNNLTRLPKGLLPWSQLAELDLRGNPWQCDCQMLWIGSVLRRVYANVQGTQPDCTCAGPQPLAGVALVSLQQDAYNCSSTANLPMIVSLLLTAVFMLLTVVLLLLMRHRRCFGSESVRKAGFYERAMVAPPASYYEKTYKESLLYAYSPNGQPSDNLSSRWPRYGNHYYYTGAYSLNEDSLWRLPLPPPPPPPPNAPCPIDQQSLGSTMCRQPAGTRL